MKYEIKNRWTGNVQFTAEIDCAEDAPISSKIGLAVKWGRKTGADLRDADLTGAVLTGAPVIPNIHQAVFAAASTKDALDMSHWHTCDTTHCRAGWVTTLAGEAGKALASKVGTPAAATLIYLASDPKIGKIPDFYCSNADALADMKALAEAEAKAGAA